MYFLANLLTLTNKQINKSRLVNILLWQANSFRLVPFLLFLLVVNLMRGASKCVNTQMETAWLCVYCETGKLTECVNATERVNAIFTDLTLIYPHIFLYSNIIILKFSYQHFFWPSNFLTVIFLTDSQVDDVFCSLRAFSWWRTNQDGEQTISKMFHFTLISV